MQRGLIAVSDTCKETIKEFQGYVWEDHEGNEVPRKVNDHLMDALRYFVKTKKLVTRVRQQYVSPLEVGVGRHG